MRINTVTKRPSQKTHEGAKASRLTPAQQLRRSVMSCLLWEDSFYEDGQSIADRIKANALAVSPQELAQIAIEARQKFHLRHVPLLLLKQLAVSARGIPGLTRNTTQAVIQRPDEMTELLALYGSKKGVPHGILKGLRQAALNFDAFQLRKWNRPGAWKLRDAAFVAHISFPDQERAQLMANIANKTYFPEMTKGGYAVKEALGLEGEPHLDMPETWEALIAAAGSDKAKRRAIWSDLLKRAIKREQGGLGYMALLRNLRNFTDDGVSSELVKAAIEARTGARHVLPFRYLQASKVTPQYHRALDTALRASIRYLEPLDGTTAVCVDCSGSMSVLISGFSQVSRLEVAAALAGCINGDVRLIAFGATAKEVAPVEGLGCHSVLAHSGVGHSTNAHLAVDLANKMDGIKRTIVITDEQVTQSLPKARSKLAYVINVAAYKNGINYHDYTHIDGFSASTIDYIRESETIA